MTDWNLKTYNGRDIKTQEGIIWLCGEVNKAYKKGNPEIKDMMALSFIKHLNSKYEKNEFFEKIDSRFVILDL